MSALCPFTGVPFLLAAVLPFGVPIGAGRGSVPYGPLNAHDRTITERVRARAALRLQRPECAGLLTDFTDRGGRTLEENLQPLGVSASRYVFRLMFVDGSRLPMCRGRSVAMVVTPGLPHVFVCPAGSGRLNSRLARIDAENASLADAMIIHEMLHTLGLGENPPSTFEITDRVLRRCR